MTPLPDHVAAQMRWLLENPAHPHLAPAAAALADELAAWVGSPAGYVPREVIVEWVRWTLFRSHEVNQKASGNTWHVVTSEDRKRLEAALSGHPPAWFVLADFGRMTAAERRRAFTDCRGLLLSLGCEWRAHFEALTQVCTVRVPPSLLGADEPAAPADPPPPMPGVPAGWVAAVAGDNQDPGDLVRLVQADRLIAYRCGPDDERRFGRVAQFARQFDPIAVIPLDMLRGASGDAAASELGRRTGLSTAESRRRLGLTPSRRTPAPSRGRAKPSTTRSRAKKR